MKAWLYGVGGLLIAAGLVGAVVLRGADAPHRIEPTASAESSEPDNGAARTDMAANGEALAPPPPPNQAEVELIPGAADLDPDTVSRLLTIERRRGEMVSVEEWEAASAAPAWSEREVPGPGLPLEEDEVEDGRVFLDFNRLKLDGAQPGDQLDLRIPQLARTYTVTIEEVREHGAGIFSWGGRLEGLPPNYTAVITQGPRHTHGGIATPEGHYTIEVHGGSGWIVSTDTISRYGEGVPHAPVPPELAEEEGDRSHRH